MRQTETVNPHPRQAVCWKPRPSHSSKRVDKNGTPVTATYSPEFDESNSQQEPAQPAQVLKVFHKRHLSFQGGDPLVPIDETVEPLKMEAREKTIPGHELTPLRLTTVSLLQTAGCRVNQIQLHEQTWMRMTC